MHRVLICGDRGWGDAETVEAALKLLKAEHGRRLFVCTGGCSRKDTKGRERSADALAIAACKTLGIEQVIYPANWAGAFRPGISNPAGILRNIRMADEFKPDEVIAFHRYIRASKGTKHMVDLARQRGIPVRIIEGAVKDIEEDTAWLTAQPTSV